MQRAATPAIMVGAGLLALLLFLIIIVVGFLGVGLSMASCDTTAGGGGAAQPGAGPAAGGIPADYLTDYRRAGTDYGVPWNVLAGIGEVESDHGRSNAPGVHSGANFAGAEGPMQFEPATFAQYGVVGYDGQKNVYDPASAIPSAGNYLKALLAEHGGDIRAAVFGYNHSASYVDTVMAWAGRYAGTTSGTTGGAAAASTPAPAGPGCVNGPGAGGAPGYSGPASPLGAAIIAAAERWLGTVYQFGGGDQNGPTVGQNSRGDGQKGFDCSGLTLYAVYQASHGKILLPHYVPDQYNNPHVQHVSYAQLQAGDLVFFDGLGHEGVYIGGGKMVDAPHTGTVVRVDDISQGFYRANFVGGGRVTG